MRLYVEFIIRHRVAVLITLALITILAGVLCSQGVVASSLGRLFLGDSPSYAEYQQRTRQFGNDEVILVAFEDRNLLSRESVERLQRVVAALERHPDFGIVQSVLQVRRVSHTDGVLTVEAYTDTALEQPERAFEILADLSADPIAGGLLVSGDGRHTVVVIELTPDPQRSAEAYPTLVDQVLETFAAEGYAAEGLHRAGMIAVLAEVMHQSTLQMSRVLPITMAVLLLTVFLLFRRLWPMVIAGVVAITGVIWSMGLAVLLFREINILLAMVPVIVLIVSFSDVIHLCSAYLLELSHGLEKEEAIVKSSTEVGLACFFTSLTTMAGFAAVALVPAPVFRQWGLILGFGVGVSLLIALTLTPVLFSLMKTPRSWRTEPAAGTQSLVDRLLTSMAGLSGKRPRLVVSLFAVVAVLALVGVFKLNVESDFINRLDEGNRLRADSRYFAEHFPGTNSLEVYIEEQEPGALLDPATFSRIAALQDEMQRMPGVERVISIVDPLRTIHRLFQGPDAGDSLPDSEAALAQYLFLLEMSGDTGLESLIDEQRTTLRLSARLGSGGFFATHDAGKRIRAAAGRLLGDDVHVEVTGLNYLLGEWLEQIVAGQRRGLLLAVITIMLMMGLALRSLRAGLVSMIPNLFPLLVLGGYLGFFWDQVDSDALIVAMVAIGIAVDDTIHFLTRYKLESARSETHEQAMQNTFHFSGRAIVITTTILVAGFAPNAFTDYLTTRMMGTLLPGCLLLALAADLLLLPALVRLGAIRFPLRGSKDGRPGLSGAGAAALLVIAVLVLGVSPATAQTGTEGTGEGESAASAARITNGVEHAAEDPARTLLLAIRDRFAGRSTVTTVELTTEGAGEDSLFRAEVWQQDSEGTTTIALFVSEPVLERGLGVRLSFADQDGEPEVTRHMFMPALDRLTEVKGLRGARLDRRLGGLVGPALLELGDDFEAASAGLEPCGNVECRKIRVTTSGGHRLDLWIEEQGGPVLRRAIQYGGGGTVRQMLEVDSVTELEGRRVEAGGTVTRPRKPRSYFRVVDCRLLTGGEEGPFTLDGFADHARELSTSTETGKGAAVESPGG